MGLVADRAGGVGATDEVAGEVRACATGLDVVQEAERVGSWHVGVEHLVLATLLDPVVRRSFLGANGDLGAVQRWAGRPLRVGPRSEERDDLPQAADVSFTPSALRYLDRLVEYTGTDPGLSRLVSTGGFRDPRARSTLRRQLLRDILDDDDIESGMPLPGLDRAAWRQVARQLHETLRSEPAAL